MWPVIANFTHSLHSMSKFYSFKKYASKLNGVNFMTPLISYKRVFYWTLLLLSSVVLIFLFGISQDSCNDVWAHALYGKIIVEEGRFPNFSDYSFVKGHDVTFKSNWLQAVLFYGSLKYLGYWGLILFKLMSIALMVVFVSLWLRQENVPWIIVVLASTIFMVAAYPRFMPRADTVNMIFLAMYIYFLQRHRRRRDRVIWFLVLAQLVWIQFHYLACLGVFCIFAYASEGRRSLEHAPQKPTNGNYRVGLCMLAILCFGVSFINLDTYRTALQPFEILLTSSGSQRELYDTIIEFFPLITMNLTIPSMPIFLRFAIPCILFMVFLYLNRDNAILPHLVLFAAFTLATLRFRRFIGLYVVVSIPLVIIYSWQWFELKLSQRAIHDLWRKKLHGAGSICTLLVNIVMIVLVFSNLLFRWDGLWLSARPYLSPLFKPVRAMEFIHKHKLYGNTYAEYDFGGFVGYHLYPHSKIFVHSLSLAYSYEHFYFVKCMLYGYVNPELMAKNYNIDVFVIFYSENRAAKVVKQLFDSPEWALVYLDETSVIHVRRDRFDKTLLNKIEIDIDNFYPDIHTDTYPYGSYRVASFFMSMEIYDTAEMYYLKALDANVYTANICNTLGVIAANKRQYLKALEYFIRSAESEPSDLTFKNIEKTLNDIPETDNQMCQKARRLYLKWRASNN